MSSRDRKDPPHPSDEKRQEVDESTRERAARKAKESDALDEALQETFPTSDPVSPFVPAVPSEPAGVERRTCSHAGCGCQVDVDEKWCSEQCRSHGQSAAHAGGACDCGHAGCNRHGTRAAAA
jgi:hypothetical protein